MSPNSARVRLYRFSYGCRRLARLLFWWTWLVAALAFIEFCKLNSAFAGLPKPLLYLVNLVPPFAVRQVWLLFRMEIGWLAGFAILWLVSAWFSVWFRYAAWWIAGYWRAALVIAAAVSLVIWRPSLSNDQWAHVKTFFTAGVFLEVAAGIVFLLLFYEVYRAHRRLVILAFVNYAGDDNLKSCVEGLAPLLLNRLGGLAELYTVVDEAKPIGKSAAGVENAVEAKVSVEDVGEVLQGAVSPESKIKFWGIEIPVGALLRVFGRMARGPRLSGSLHKDGARLVLIARIDRGRRPGTSWRIGPEDLPDGPDGAGSDVVVKMHEQLAFRVFADLVPAISQRWQAVRCYTDGLRSLSITTRTRTDKEVNLRKAERAFLQALAIDNKFARNHYNLGIVYISLEQSAAARAAFRNAVKEDPTLAQAYYALANDAWSQGDNSGAIGFCEQVIALQPGEARAWDLKGLAERKLQEQQLREPLKAGQHPEVWQESLVSREIGAALAGRALCKALLLGRAVNAAREIARGCVRSAGVAHAMLQDGQGKTILQQALYLAPVTADLHFELGKVLSDAPENDWRTAESHFRTAAHIEPTRSLYWAYVASACGKLFQSTTKEEYRRNALAACQRAMDNASGIDPEIQGQVQTALTAIADPDEARRFLYIVNCLNLLQKLERRSPPARRISGLERVERWWHNNLTPEWDWPYAQVAIKLAKSCLNTDPERAQTLLENAIARLKERHQAEIREQGLHALLAQAYQNQQKPELLGPALLCAERAVEFNPQRAGERSILAGIFWALGEQERAETEWQTCLDLSPEHGFLTNIASTYWERGTALRNPAEREKAFRRVIEFYGRALRSIESKTLSDQNLEQQTTDHGYVHYWTGRFHQELLEFDEAVSHIQTAKRLTYKPLESTIYLGWIYTEARAYDAAEASFREAVARIREQQKKHGKRLADIDSGRGEDTPINELLTICYLLWSFSYSDRGVRLEKAVHLAQNARWLIQQLDQPKVQPYEATYFDCLGYAHLKMGQIEEAARELKHSVTLSVDAGAYTRLAEACLARATASPTVRDSCIAEARQCCAKARGADLRRQYSQIIKDLEDRLDVLAKPAK